MGEKGLKNIFQLPLTDIITLFPSLPMPHLQNDRITRNIYIPSMTYSILRW